MTEIENLEMLLNNYIDRKKAELKVVNSVDIAKEIQTELNCADLFKFFIGVVKQCH